MSRNHFSRVKLVRQLLTSTTTRKKTTNSTEVKIIAPMRRSIRRAPFVWRFPVHLHSYEPNPRNSRRNEVQAFYRRGSSPRRDWLSPPGSRSLRNLPGLLAKERLSHMRERPEE